LGHHLVGVPGQFVAHLDVALGVAVGRFGYFDTKQIRERHRLEE
jgi:hypothetical protein